MSNNNFLYWLWLSNKFGVYSEHYAELLMKFDCDVERIFNLTSEEIESLTFLRSSQKKALQNKSLDFANNTITFCKEQNVRILTYCDDDFPILLKRIKKCPILLYVAGELPNLNDSLCISVVGTRKMSEYGMRMAYKLSYELSKIGVITVSGMALGIDGISAAGTIVAGGKTVAVLASGIDVCYPKEHEKLMQNIVSNGAVITPYPPSRRAERYTFVERNAIVSGISDGTLVVEAPINSGALITATDAFEQSRLVFALPGNIESKNSKGTNELIKKGAIPITGVEDIVKAFADNKEYILQIERLSETEKESDFRSNAVVEVGAYFENEKIIELKQDKSVKQEPIIKHIGEERVRGKLPEYKENGIDELNTLNGIERKIYLDIPLNEPITVEELSNLGYSAKDASVALMMLEIKGLVESLPGGTYIRK